MQAGKTLMQSMFWRGLYYVSAFIINILIARHFEASVSGSIYYISSIYALVLLFTSLSFESGIIYFVAKKEIPVARLFSFSLLWTMLVGLITFVVVYSFFKEGYQQISSGLMIFSAVFYISGNLLITYFSAFFYADNNFRIPNIIIVAGAIFLMLTLPFGGKSIIPGVNDGNYFYLYFGAYFVQGILMTIAVKINYIRSGFLKLLSVVEYKLILRYCGLAFAGNIIFFLLYRVDYFFVEKFCSARELGNYIQVSKLVHLFFILPTILAGAVFPLTAGGQKAEINKLLTLLSRSIFVLYIVACLCLGLVGKWLFPFVFGESFTEMYNPFLLLIPGILALSGIFTLTAYFAGSNRINVNIRGSVYALVVILIGDLLFIPQYGISAAALVSSAGYIVYQVYIIAVFKKEYPCAVSDFFIFRLSDIYQIKKSISNARKGKHESQ